MKILVTGGAGFLGSVAVPQLLSDGHQVRVLDSLMFNQIGPLALYINPDFEFIKGDMRDNETVKRALDGVDFVINLAALVGAPLCKQREKEAWEVNYEAALLVESLRAPGQGYLFPNSTSGYGTRNPVDGLCTEDTPMEPISTYGQTKVKAEQELITKPDVVSYRFTTVFGLSPRLRLDLMPNEFMWRAIHEQALTIFEPEFQRSFIHITDIARCLAFTIENFDKMKGRSFNVGHESMNMTKRQLAEQISEKTGCKLSFDDSRADPDKRNYFVSFGRIQEMGFIPRIRLDQGLTALREGLKTVEWSSTFTNVQ